jgi:putative phage-type endonuclease
MEIIKNIEQGSKEWHDLRLGLVTASRVKDVMTKGRGNAPSKTAETYMYELLAELMTGEAKPFFENDAMKWGTETEPQARAMYEIKNNVNVNEVAFILSGETGNLGVSPDGLVGDNGLIEIKCPTTITQLKRSQSEKPYIDYYDQIQCQLWVSGREWCDFVSFDPRLDIEAGYIQVRVNADIEYIKSMKLKVLAFIEELTKLNNKLLGE